MGTSTWVSVSEAVRLTGLSARTINRMATEGKLRYRRTPGGHIRVLRESLDKVLRPGSEASDSSSSVLQSQRERVQGLFLEGQELRAKREIRKLREEDSQSEHTQTLRARSQVLAREQSLEETRLRQQQVDREEVKRQREEWLRRQINRAFTYFPQWLSPAQEREVVGAVGAELERWQDTDDEMALEAAVKSKIQRCVASWAAEREAMRRREELIEQVCWRLPLGKTDADVAAAREAARERLGRIPLSASQLELQTAVNAAITPITHAIEERNRQARAEQAERARKSREDWDRTQRQANKASLLGYAKTEAGLFVCGERENVEFESDQEFWQIKARVEEAVKERLEAELTGDEGRDAVSSRVRGIARETLNEICSEGEGEDFEHDGHDDED